MTRERAEGALWEHGAVTVQILPLVSNRQRCYAAAHPSSKTTEIAVIVQILPLLSKRQRCYAAAHPSSKTTEICTVSNRDPGDEFLLEIPEGPRPPPSLSPRTLRLRDQILEESLSQGREEFSHKPSLNNGYRYRVPTADERVWMMPEFGMYGIPLILFHFGLRLSMYFFKAMYEAIGCGVGQLAPNSVAQLSVAGSSLQKILNSGIREEMDKAMLLLVLRASRGAIDVSKPGPSRPGHYVSIELLDDQGNKVVKDRGKVLSDVDPAGANPRKWLHREIGGEEVGEVDMSGGDVSCVVHIELVTKFF
ncbi:hypothetical protein AgCh_013546 [Apium graveolens]